jgi:multicomponent Na+:H+ antiporter subunit E
VLHALSLGTLLGLLWLLLSGILEAWLLLLGLGSVIVVLVFANRMDVIDHEGHPIHISWRALLYWPWLALEIFKANWDVARVILSPKMPITPKILRIKAPQVTELGHVFYANSNGAMDVHSLTRTAEEGLLSGEMGRRVHAVEGAADDTVVGRKNV